MENLIRGRNPPQYQRSPCKEVRAALRKRPEEELQCLEMTTKRKIIGRLVPCRCFRGEEEIISVLDYSHCSLQQVPKEVFNFERTLEELYLDANQIEELPKQLFNCQALRKLSIPDNDLSNLPTTIASLVNLKELDISKNGVQEFPENIKCCKCLTIIEASVNPISKLPDGFTQLLNLTQLYLNDAFLEFLPANFGSWIVCQKDAENPFQSLRFGAPKSQNKSQNIIALCQKSLEHTCQIADPGVKRKSLENATKHLKIQSVPLAQSPETIQCHLQQTMWRQQLFGHQKWQHQEHQHE